jgi:hypothetical protein
MKIETKKIWIANEWQGVDIKKFSPDEFKERMYSLPLEIFTDEKKYIPKMVEACWLKGAYSLNKESGVLSYTDMLNLYQAVMEVNPELNFEHYRINPLGKIKRGNKPIIKNSPSLEKSEQKEESIHSLEDTVSIIDFNDLFNYYNKGVIGQEEAIMDICKILINLKHMGMSKKGVASYYLLGPSGVGKTSSIKLLSDFLCIPLCYIQGSEYKEPHSDSKLFGAPPSYVGYDDEGGILTRYIKKNSEGIVLFDEIDKVHPAIYGTLTNFLGDSFIVNPSGERCDFNGLVFFTSNTGNKLSEQGIGRKIGFN